jgi:hypothetical protein
MKKLVASIIILIILGAIIGIIGLIHVPESTYAVVHTTFRGFEAGVLNPNTFTWRWEKLIPTVLNTYLFKLEPYKIDTELLLSGNFLAQGKDLAASVAENASFDTGSQFMTEFSIKPDKLRDLAAAGLRPESLPQWYREKAQLLSGKISQIVLKEPKIFSESDFLERINTILKDAPGFDSISITTITPGQMNAPDYGEYLDLRKKYFEIERLKLDAEEAKINAEKERDLLAIKKEIDIIQNLDRYGEMFKNYPILLEFLYLRNLKPEEFLKLSEVNFSKGK